MMGHCWHFSAKSAIFLHLFLTVLNSSTRNHQNLMMLPRLLYSLASILILFFGEFSDKESGKLSSVAMIAVDKGMTGGRCRTEETKLPYGPEKLNGDLFT